MRDALWVNDDGTVSSVQVDDDGNRVDLVPDPQGKPGSSPKADQPTKGKKQKTNK